MTQHRKTRLIGHARRWFLRLVYAVLFLLTIVVFGADLARRVTSGPRAGRIISAAINPTIKGRMELGSVYWSADAAMDLLRGRPTPVVVEHFAVYDPRGVRVIYAPLAMGRIDLRALIAHLDIEVDQLRVVDGDCLVASSPGPSGISEIGISQAFAARLPKVHLGRGTGLAFTDFTVEHARVRLRFGTFSLTVSDVNTRGSFVYSGGPMEKDGMLMLNQTGAASAAMRAGGQHFAFSDIVARSLYRSIGPPVDLPAEVSATMQGARVTAHGMLKALFGADPTFDVTAQGSGLAPFIAGLTGQPIAGGARFSAHLSGPLSTPVVRVTLADVSLGQPPNQAQITTARALLDVGRLQLSLASVTGNVLRGSVSGTGRLDLGSLHWQAALTAQGLKGSAIDPALPGELSGAVRLDGELSQGFRAHAEVNMNVAGAGSIGLPDGAEVRGGVHLGPEVIDLARLSVTSRGNSVAASGSVNLKLRRVNVAVTANLPHAARLLEAHGLPPVIQRLNATLRITGKYPLLGGAGSVTAEDVGYGDQRVGSLVADVGFAEGKLTLRRIRSLGFGGRLSGEASLDLFRGDVAHPLSTPILLARLNAAAVDLNALAPGAGLTGSVSGEVQVSGPVDELRGIGELEAPRVTFKGDRYEGCKARLGLLGDRFSVYEAGCTREKGGKLRVWGDVFFDQRLAIQARVQSLPLAAIPGVSRQSFNVAGTVSGEVHAVGSLADPRFDGRLAFAGIRLRGVALGEGTLALSSTADATQLRGTFFGRMAALEGYLFMKGEHRLLLSLRLIDLPVDQLVYELKQLGDLQARLTGDVRLEVDDKKGLTWEDARFSQVAVSMKQRNAGRRSVTTLTLKNRDDVMLRYRDATLELVTAELLTGISGEATDQAVFFLGGTLAANKVDVRLRGRLAGALLQFALPGKIRKIEGYAAADVQVTGTLRTPKLLGRLTAERILVWMPKFDRPISIPAAEVELVPARLWIKQFKLRLGRAEVHAAGTIALHGLGLSLADIAVRGDVNVALLELLFPEHFTSASGRTSVDVHIGGLLSDPMLQGVVTIGQMELSPRGWGRTIALERGSVRFSNSEIRVLTPLEGRYEEGFLRVQGEVRLDRWDLVDVYLKIAGTGIPQRRPNVYAAEVNADVVLFGDSAQLELQGAVELVDVRYVQEFDIIRQAFFKPRVDDEEPPFWQGSPLLANLKLALNVRSTGQMLVKNSYAQLSLSGAAVVLGQLSEPHLGGQIRVEEGTFRIPFLRGVYTISTGDIVLNKRRPVEQAELTILGETEFVDRSGVVYQIQLRLVGPLTQIGIRLTSEPPLEQGQIWTLLATGRTTEQLRAQVRGTGAETSKTDPAAGAADAQVKQITGEIMQQIIVDQLNKVTRLDLFRFELGTESAQIRAEQKVGRYLSVGGEYEIGLLGTSRAEGRMAVKVHDLLKLVGSWERLSTRIETDDLDPSRGRVELKLSLPIR